jgi:hypothetical protein
MRWKAFINIDLVVDESFNENTLRFIVNFEQLFWVPFKVEEFSMNTKKLWTYEKLFNTLSELYMKQAMKAAIDLLPDHWYLAPISIHSNSHSHIITYKYNKNRITDSFSKCCEIQPDRCINLSSNAWRDTSDIISFSVSLFLMLL